MNSLKRPPRKAAAPAALPVPRVRAIRCDDDSREGPPRARITPPRGAASDVIAVVASVGANITDTTESVETKAMRPRRNRKPKFVF